MFRAAIYPESGSSDWLRPVDGGYVLLSQFVLAFFRETLQTGERSSAGKGRLRQPEPRHTRTQISEL
jgi:hypothetical protein